MTEGRLSGSRSERLAPLRSPLWFLSQCISISLFISPSTQWALALIEVGRRCWEREDATAPVATTESSSCAQICARQHRPAPLNTWSQLEPAPGREEGPRTTTHMALSGTHHSAPPIFPAQPPALPSPAPCPRQPRVSSSQPPSHPTACPLQNRFHSTIY